MQSWWMPALATGVGRTWVDGRYDDAGPDFCYLTYETLHVGDHAYTDGRGTCISRSGYDDYIVRDVLRLRRR
jgi:hypothetical protein